MGGGVRGEVRDGVRVMGLGLGLGSGMGLGPGLGLGLGIWLGLGCGATGRWCQDSRGVGLVTGRLSQDS